MLKRQPVVILLDEIDAVLAVARQREENEARIRAELAKGRTNWDISDFKALLRRNGIGNQL